MVQAWRTLQRAVSDFVDDDATTLAGALAFYAALGLAPIVLIVIKVASVLDPRAQDHIIAEIVGFVGPRTGVVISEIVAAAEQQPDSGTIATLLGLATLAFSASGVFGQLQASLNRIWGVQAKPGPQLKSWIVKRLLSFGMVLTIAFLMLVSLVLSAAISAVFAEETPFWSAMNVVASLALFTALFAAMFRYLPDVKLGWRDVWTGAAVTALLFTIGKSAIGLYLARSSVSSAYGAAGSLVVLLLWVYYSGLVFFLGAEITEAHAGTRSAPIAPSTAAERVEPPAVRVARSRRIRQPSSDQLH
jgi:membrane protein